MTTTRMTGPSWKTSSFGGAAGLSPIEMSSLHEHLNLCKALRGPWFVLRCHAEAMHGFIAARFVTSLVAMALLIGVGLLVS